SVILIYLQQPADREVSPVCELGWRRQRLSRFAPVECAWAFRPWRRLLTRQVNRNTQSRSCRQAEANYLRSCSQLVRRVFNLSTVRPTWRRWRLFGDILNWSG